MGWRNDIRAVDDWMAHILGGKWAEDKGICRAGEENVTNGPKLHPNQKPVALLRRIISYSDTTGLIYDSHIGSGSTLCAAWDLDRPATGCDIAERCCEMAAKRLEFRKRRAPLFADEKIA